MKDKLFRRRKHIDWNKARLDLGDVRVDCYYLTHFDSSLSLNRQSYWALLHVYGKKAVDAFRLTGCWC
jgi:hypothetical protein